MSLELGEIWTNFPWDVIIFVINFLRMNKRARWLCRVWRNRLWPKDAWKRLAGKGHWWFSEYPFHRGFRGFWITVNFGWYSAILEIHFIGWFQFEVVKGNSLRRNRRTIILRIQNPYCHEVSDCGLIFQRVPTSLLGYDLYKSWLNNVLVVIKRHSHKDSNDSTVHYCS